MQYVYVHIVQHIKIKKYYKFKKLIQVIVYARARM